ncbi:MAG: ABC transporter permease, partial [Nocardioidaceae bacterium]
MTSFLNIAKTQRALWMLIGVCVVMTFASPVFLTQTNLLNVALAVSVTALLAAGQTYVIILAEIDLSVGAVLGFTAAVTALTLESSSAIVAVLVGVGTGALIGLVNGLFVTKARMPSFIVTLAMMSVLSGLTLQVTAGNPVAVDDYSFQNIGQAEFAGIPVPVCLMLIGFAVLGVLLARTRYGRFVYATGDNAESARLSGIRVDRVKITA